MTNPFYSNEEIRTLYRQAKNKKRQIGILADLNCCTKEEIRKIISQEDTPMATSKTDRGIDRAICVPEKKEGSING